MRLTVFYRIMMCAATAALSASAQNNSSDTSPANNSAPAVTATNGAPNAAPPSAPISGPGAEVLKLAQSGVGDDVVLAFVNNSTSKYNLSANDILALKDAGLSQSAISAMISHDRGIANPRQTGGSTAPVVVSNNSTAGSGPSYEQKLYASSASPIPVTQYAPQYSSPTVPNAPTVSQAPSIPSAEAPAAPPSAPPQVEVVPVSPGPTYYWVPGYWAWRGGGWVWIRGAWLLPPRHGAVWVSGHWAPHGHGYVWIGGGWR